MSLNHGLMNEEQQYLFDTRGYITIEGAIPPDKLLEIHTVINERLAHEPGDRKMIRWGCDPVQTNHPHDERCVLSFGEVFRDLIDNPALLSVLEAVLGRSFRLDHDSLDVWRGRGHGPIGSRLHGGELPWDFPQYYTVRGGRIHCGLLTVLYHLHDVAPEEGGFGCIPGSHKSDFPLPASLDWLQAPENHETAHVVRVGGKAGTAVIFAEALMHGALPWTSDRERRTLFYKYNNGSTAWSNHFYDASRWPDLSERARFILEPPNARHPRWYPRT